MWGLPVDASAHGYQIDQIILFVHLLMFVLFVGWAGYFILAVFKFRKSRHPQADYHGVKNHFSSYIEIGVVIAEAVLLVGLSIPFWAKHVNAFPERSDTLKIRVIAQQFAWNIHYPGKDGIFGKTNLKFVNEQGNPIGLDLSDPHAKDDIVTINQLHLPIGHPALIYLSSKDVIHSFSLPVMRVKQDIIPGMSIPTWFTPTKTGNFEIACAQLCGLSHYRMRGYLVVQSDEEFNAWLEEQSASLDSQGSADNFWN